MRRTLFTVLVVALFGCGDDDGSDTDVDGGPARDAGPRDAGDDLPDDGGELGDAALAVDQFVPPVDMGVDGGPVLDPDYMASTRHTAVPLGTGDAPAGFWEYLPPGYDAEGAPSPLLIFFHGLGENGDGSRDALDNLLRAGPSRFIDRDEWPNTRPFVVLSMQTASGCPSANAIRDFLAWAIANYNVDADRLYLTGLSCGAIGIANYLRVHIDESPIAAVVAISGNWNSAWTNRMCELGQVAIWGIHGSDDANGGTPPGSTEGPMTNLIACPAPPRRDARLNMLEGVGHNGAAWNATYNLDNGLPIYTWMLDQHL
ncbi:MAG: hypothetical protein JJ863_03750 [Deltaproteobacteria bacterium]|nr:hypothetical protein [Deltaproteobacteria bacterium]